MKTEIIEAQIVNDMGVVASVQLVNEKVVQINIKQVLGWHEWNDLADAVRRVMLMMDVEQP